MRSGAVCLPSKRFGPALAYHKYTGSLRIITTIFRSRAASPLAALLPYYTLKIRSIPSPVLRTGLEDKFILKTGSSLFPKICRSYFLFTPHGLGDFLDQFELVPLFQLGQLVADLTGGKAALRTQAKTVERDILFCLMDAGDYKAFPYPNGAVVIDNPPYYRGLPDHLRKRRKGRNIICDELQRRDCGADRTGFDKGNQPGK